jgi:hypothetical protein
LTRSSKGDKLISGVGIKINEGIKSSATNEYLLSKAWSDFRDYKSWSEKYAKEYTHIKGK